MSDTTAVTSDVKSCNRCGATFGEDDDKRYNECKGCRTGEKPLSSDPSVFTHEIPQADQGTDATSETPGVEPLLIDLPHGDPVEMPPKEYYWCGVTEDAPWSLITLGGINFQKTMGRVIDGGQGQQEFQDHTDVGVVHHLTEAQVAVVLEHAKNKSVRRYRPAVIKELGGSRRTYLGDLISHRGSHLRPYFPQPGDIPIGNFVWMVKVRHKKDRPMENPPTLVKRHW